VLFEDPIGLLPAPLAQGRVTRITDHRPWPLPKRRWVMAQTWKNLLFAHWPVEPEALRAVMPSQLPLDTFEGRAWLGLTPFAVRNLRVRFTCPLPILSAFPEINVRTYVTLDGKPGIYFFSLDADSLPAVETARRFYRVPYFHARMAIHTDDGEVRFETERTGPEHHPPHATFRARYRPRDEPFLAGPGTLEHWLTERYCLYTLNDQRRPLRGDIHHRPWSLQHATADIEVNTMAAAIAPSLDGEPLLHYAARQDVVFWKLEEP
jgi:uncharacterized protein YqjF (DUF2071 family)